MDEQQMRAIVQDEVTKILGNAASMPIEVLQALSHALYSVGFARQQASSKATSTVTQEVNEAGTASPYNVAKVPDGFIQIDDTGKNIPYYS